MILQLFFTTQISCKTHKWRTLEKSRQQCAFALPRDHSPSCWQPRISLSRCHGQDGRLSSHVRWFLSESRPVLYRPPVFLSEDPNATLSPSAISRDVRRLSTTTAHSRTNTTGPICRALAIFTPKPVWTFSYYRWSKQLKVSRLTP